jgi:predicted Rossmann-fold nucleotide-binding protein
MDEFFESMTLMQTEKADCFPVVLMGTRFWNGLMDWVKEVMLGDYQNISQDDMDRFILTDDIDQAVDHIRSELEKQNIKLPDQGESEPVRTPRSTKISAEGLRYGLPPIVNPVRRSMR